MMPRDQRRSAASATISSSHRRRRRRPDRNPPSVSASPRGRPSDARRQLRHALEKALAVQCGREAQSEHHRLVAAIGESVRYLRRHQNEITFQRDIPASCRRQSRCARGRRVESGLRSNQSPVVMACRHRAVTCQNDKSARRPYHRADASLSVSRPARDFCQPDPMTMKANAPADDQRHLSANVPCGQQPPSKHRGALWSHSPSLQRRLWSGLTRQIGAPDAVQGRSRAR